MLTKDVYDSLKPEKTPQAVGSFLCYIYLIKGLKPYSFLGSLLKAVKNMYIYNGVYFKFYLNICFEIYKKGNSNLILFQINFK
jgi:hypothetical protein